MYISVVTDAIFNMRGDYGLMIIQINVKNFERLYFMDNCCTMSKIETRSMEAISQIYQEFIAELMLTGFSGLSSIAPLLTSAHTGSLNTGA
ncbi:MAG: hypothetical protein AMK70_00815 [Nitrospira bacterium SG8_35_1]|nr:MAG: hypothetical protein AMK70_00815 [Nitrospira bacterium SG8_35_1]